MYYLFNKKLASLGNLCEHHYLWSLCKFACAIIVKFVRSAIYSWSRILEYKRMHMYSTMLN